MDLPPEREQLNWREAFWRFLALWFVRARLGAEEEPPAAETDLPVTAPAQAE